MKNNIISELLQHCYPQTVDTPQTNYLFYFKLLLILCGFPPEFLSTILVKHTHVYFCTMRS